MMMKLCATMYVDVQSRLFPTWPGPVGSNIGGQPWRSRARCHFWRLLLRSLVRRRCVGLPMATLLLRVWNTRSFPSPNQRRKENCRMASGLEKKSSTNTGESRDRPCLDVASTKFDKDQRRGIEGLFSRAIDGRSSGWRMRHVKDSGISPLGMPASGARAVRRVARPAARARLEAHEPGRSFGRCEGIGNFSKDIFFV
jgi:hypothetical protein